MKSLYKTPEIKVEELAKVDVLCASNEAEPEQLDNYTLLDSIWEGLTNLF